MTVMQLIEKLKQFPQNLEVTITDGYEAACYHTNNIEIKIFEDTIDIGIGGNRE